MTNKRYIISFDIANKSLAVAVLEINEINYYNLKNKIISENSINNMNANENVNKKQDSVKKSSSIIKTKKLISQIKNLNNKVSNILNSLNNNIIIHILEVKDLLDGKLLSDTNLIQRTHFLSKYLMNLDKLIKEKINIEWGEIYNSCEVLIEYQMNSNDKSRTIQNQILYHYINKLNNERIHIVNPGLKNQIFCYSSEKGIYNKYGDFIEKYSTNYSANKNHSKACFLDFLKKRKCFDLVVKIKKKNLDDIADAFIMAIVFYTKYIL